MTPQKWRFFRILLAVFLLTASLAIFVQGGFRSMGLVGLGLLLLAFAAVGVIVYLFVRGEPQGPHRG